MKTIKRRVMVVVMSFFLILTSSAQCLYAFQEEHSPFLTQNKKFVYGGTLTWGSTNPPLSFNPIISIQGVSTVIINLIYNRLVRINAKGHIEADLAKEWEISPDGLNYIFQLRQGVHFHNGIELTAKDVVATFQEIFNPANQSPFRSSFKVIKSVKDLDRYKVEISLKEPMPGFLYKLTECEIGSEHIFRMDQSISELNDHPVGTGPFKFESWNKRTNQIVLVANQDYFEGRPYLDKMIIKIFPNSTSLWAAFMRQEVDMVKFISYEDYDVLAKDGIFKTYAVSSGLYYGIAYNLRDPLMTKNLRRAIAYAINVKDMIGSNGNNGLISQGPIYQSGTVPELSNRIEYNPAEALRLLKADGWGDQDRDGVLDKSGNSLIIKVLVNSRKTIELKILKIIRQQLSEVGIRVEALYFDPEREAGVHFISQSKAQAWLKLFIGPSNEAENYEEVMQWIPGLGRLEDDNGYKNEEVKRIFQLIKSERDDEKRSGLFNRINQIIYDDQPVCFLFYPANFFAVSSRIGNTDEYFTPFMPSYTMKDWRVIK